MDIPLNERLLLPQIRARQLVVWASHHGYSGSAVENSDIESLLAIADRLELLGRERVPQLWGVSHSSGDDGYLVEVGGLEPVEIKSAERQQFKFHYKDGSEKSLDIFDRWLRSTLLFDYTRTDERTMAQLHEIWIVRPGSAIHQRIADERARVARGDPSLKKDGTPRKYQEKMFRVCITDVRNCGYLLFEER